MTTYKWRPSARSPKEGGWIEPFHGAGDIAIPAQVGPEIVQRLNELQDALRLMVDTFGPVSDVTDYPEERAALQQAEAVLKKR